MSEPSSQLEAIKPICRALQRLLPGTVEVVLHDLTRGQIAHIENAFSPRRVGDDSLVETENYQTELRSDGTIGPYRKANPDGSAIKSVSALIPDQQGRAIGLLCINMRTDHLEAAAAALSALVASKASDDSTMLKNDWRELANRIIAETLRERNLGLVQAKRPDRLAIVAKLEGADIFSARGSADYVAEALGISRASLYGLLGEARRPALQGKSVA